jgi:multidrug resistance protein MdtO
MEGAFREECSRSLRNMADSLENQLNKKPYDTSAPRSLLRLLETSPAEEQEMFSEREGALLRMSRTIASLVDRMQNEVASEPLYAKG